MNFLASRCDNIQTNNIDIASIYSKRNWPLNCFNQFSVWLPLHLLLLVFPLQINWLNPKHLEIVRSCSACHMSLWGRASTTGNMKAWTEAFEGFLEWIIIGHRQGNNYIVHICKHVMWWCKTIETMCQLCLN